MYIHELSASALTDAALFAIERQMNDNQWHTYKLSGSDLKSALTLAGFITTTSDTLVYYYTKSQTYSKTEVNALIESVKNSRFEKVETLPVTGESNVIYLVPRSEEETNNVYDEYIWLDEAWEKIGSTDIDLSGYVTTQALNTILADYMTTSAFNTAIANYYNKSEINSQMAAKVDKEAGKGLSTNDYTSVEKDKLAGISPSAKKVSASSINGNIQIDEVETTVYDDSEIKQDLSTDTATVTGNPLNFTTLTAQKANKTVISLEPIQDLHGYDHPWPAGGGKNKLQMTVDGIKAANTDGTWTGNAYTLNGVTFTIQTYAGNNVTGILINGNSTSVTLLILNPSFLLKSDSYILNGAPESSGVETWRWQVNLGSQLNIDSGNGNSFTVSEDFPNSLSFIRVGSGMNLQNVLFQPMIRLATETDPTFAPYSNICPIDGRTETSLVGCGKNLVNPQNFADRPSPWNESAIRNCIYFENLVGDVTVSIGSGAPCLGSKYLGNTRVGETIEISPNENHTFTLNDGEGLWMWVVSGSNMSDIANFQVELGSTATTYEPYVESNNLTIQFGEKVYGAKVELEKGTVTVDRKYASMPSSGYGVNEQHADYWKLTCPISDCIIVTNADKETRIISDMFNGVSAEKRIVKPYNISIISSQRMYVYVPKADFATTQDFMDWITANNPHICYELEEPYTITLTPNEISLLMGINNISADGDSIKLTYRDGKVATLGDLDGLVKKIADCDDVEITDLQAGDSLVWDATTGKWKNQQSTNTHVYSTTEQVVGTWIDGSTIYEKSYELSSILSLNSNVWVDTEFDDTNISRITKSEGFADGVANASVLASVNANTQKIQLLNLRSSNISISHFTIQYTKTTPTLLMQSTEESTPADESESTDENR